MLLAVLSIGLSDTLSTPSASAPLCLSRRLSSLETLLPLHLPPVLGDPAPLVGTSLHVIFHCVHRFSAPGQRLGSPVARGLGRAVWRDAVFVWWMPWRSSLPGTPPFLASSALGGPAPLVGTSLHAIFHCVHRFCAQGQRPGSSGARGNRRAVRKDVVSGWRRSRARASRVWRAEGCGTVGGSSAWGGSAGGVSLGFGFRWVGLGLGGRVFGVELGTGLGVELELGLGIGRASSRAASCSNIRPGA